MKKLLSISFVLLFTLSCFSQINFNHGYFVDDRGAKTECFIKNDNYTNTTQSLSYRLSEKAKTQTVSLKNINEIVIFNASKFIKRTVEIGKSNERNLHEEDYSFNEDELFLKVLVEGKASLYSFYEKGVETFFFGFNGGEIEQLVYKTWLLESNVKRENFGYRKQLFEKLTCETINFNIVNNLKYERKDLLDFFVKYNDCKDSKMTVYDNKTKTFNVNLRPRLNFTSLTLNERGDRINPRSHDFGNQTLFGFGIEFEALLPLLNNKLSVSVEPTYVGEFSSEKIIESEGNVGESVAINYKSFNIPLTLRHYSYINTNSKFFVNASVVFDFPVKSNSIVYRINDNIIEKLNPEGSANFAFGGGYKFKNKFGIEARYETNRNIINQSIDYSTKHTTFSIILGYSIL